MNTVGALIGFIAVYFMCSSFWLAYKNPFDAPLAKRIVYGVVLWFSFFFMFDISAMVLYDLKIIDSIPPSSFNDPEKFFEVTAPASSGVGQLVQALCILVLQAAYRLWGHFFLGSINSIRKQRNHTTQSIFQNQSITLFIIHLISLIASILGIISFYIDYVD